jgi:hypothetical protein
MDRFHAGDVQLAPGAAAGRFSRADLVFYGVEHRGPSFEALVFIDAPDAGPETPRDPADGFAGSFVVFGHRGCFGGEGHCDVPEQRDPFDGRPPHALTPQTKFVEVTAALKHARREGESVSVTVLPVVPGRERARQADVLFFTGLRLLAYR